MMPSSSSRITGKAIGVTPGAEGFVTTVRHPDPGTLIISSFDAAGKGPGTAFGLCEVHWLSLAPGYQPFESSVSTLTDINGEGIGNPRAGNGRVRVMKMIYGDVNDTLDVNIVEP